MQQRIFVKPASPDVRVRNEHTRQHIAESGELVPDTSYYRRRIADGDLVETEPPAAQTEE
jgi:hypothetical protein